MCCSVLQCVAVCCSELPPLCLQTCLAAATRDCCSMAQCVAVCCNERLLLCLPTAHNTPVSQCNTLHHTATNCNTLQHTAQDSNTLQHTATHCNTLQRSRPHGASCLLFCCVGVFPFLFLGMRRKYNECIVPGVSQCFVPLIIDLFLNLIFSKHASRPQRASASPFCGGICVCVLCGQTSCECRDIVAEA